MKHTAENITDICMDFLRKSGYSFSKITAISYSPLSRQWTASVDVGVLNEIPKKIIVDDENGKIIEFK